MATLEKNYTTCYGANVHTLAQQRGSVLRNYVTLEKMVGEKLTFERVHPTTAVEVTSKYQDSPIIETRYDRRTLHGKTYAWGDMIDFGDNLNTLLDPTSSVVRAGAMALGRVIDDIIVQSAFMGVAYEGRDGLDTVEYKESQKISVAVGGNGKNTGFNIDKLLEVISRFGCADIDLDDPENEVYMAVTQRQLDDLARNTDITNRNYEMVQALYTGKTKNLLGVNFVRIGQQRLPTTELDGGLSRMCPAWVKSGVALALPMDINMAIETRIEKMNNWYALGRMKAGSTRIEDEKVLQVYCLEN